MNLNSFFGQKIYISWAKTLHKRAQKFHKSGAKVLHITNDNHYHLE